MMLLTGLLIGLFSMPVTTHAATLPLDVQCWHALGMEEAPPAGQLSALVERCVDDLRNQEALHRNEQEAALRRSGSLHRTATQAQILRHIHRRLEPPAPASTLAVQRPPLPSRAQRRAALEEALAALTKRRAWLLKNERLHVPVRVASKTSFRECRYLIGVEFAECIDRYLHPSGNQTPPPEPSLPLTFGDAEQITLSPQETYETKHGVRITFIDVRSDSRCPLGVVCIRAGDAAIRAKIFSPELAEHSAELVHLLPITLTIPELSSGAMAPQSGANAVMVGRCTVVFSGLSPYPQSKVDVVKSRYRATFFVLNPGDRDCAS